MIIKDNNIRFMKKFLFVLLSSIVVLACSDDFVDVDSFDEDSEGNDRKVGTTDASSAGLSLSLSRSSWSVKWDSYNSIKINLVNQVL